MFRWQSLFSQLKVSTHKIRVVRSKGAALVLLWNFISFFIASFAVVWKSNSFRYAAMICFAATPVTGWLADVYFGRYKIISYSIRLIWAVIIMFNLYFVVNNYVYEFRATLNTTIQVILSGLICIGLAGILANGLQLGIEQLIDASCKNITCYISWYVWSYPLAVIMVALSENCFCGIYNLTWSFILIPCAVTLSLLSDCFLNHWLMKEPVTHNPLKLIYQVLRYAVKNKYPRLRSAFTYWEDKPYSRIDLGKAKYGGPFTTEQVEDVKTFFRILALLLVCSLLIGLYTTRILIHSKLIHHYQDKKFIKYCEDKSVQEFLGNCYEQIIIQYFNFLAIVIFVPVYELVLHPLLLKCDRYANSSILLRLIIAILFFMASTLQQFAIELVATHNTNNQNVTCSFYPNDHDLIGNERLSLDYHWLIIPQTFQGISFYLASVSALEFIVAQAPHYMRSQLIGTIFFLYGSSLGLVEVCLKAIEMLFKKEMLLQKDCGGIWYYTAMTAATFLILCIVVIAKRCYSPRRRDEDLHNHQIFAVNYFDKYLPHNT